MNKKPVEVNIKELEEILEKYINSKSDINFAIKIVGHPGVGKSAIVKQVSERLNNCFIDTRLAFKENIDLGGYPVPDHENRQMIYYRPKFIPPETVPEDQDGIVWFLDESNRAHPTVIQTLFQIITERRCGEHKLPENTSIILAGNLGESDNTTITEFDDSALDGRLAVFHLKPSTSDWLMWACDSGIHPSVINYISIFPENLWDEERINPNPRGWHQVSQALILSYGLNTEKELQSYLMETPGNTLEKMIVTLTGDIAGNDFILQMTSPRKITTAEILEGNTEKLQMMKEKQIPAEDILWASTGAVNSLKDKNIQHSGKLPPEDLIILANTLQFISESRADSRASFFYLLLKECGLFTQIPEAIKTISCRETRETLVNRFGKILEN